MIPISRLSRAAAALLLAVSPLTACAESEVVPADAQELMVIDSMLGAGAVASPPRLVVETPVLVAPAPLAEDSLVFPGEWPRGPQPVNGALLPQRRIVCYYGNPNSTRMGALGEFPKDEMLQRLDDEVENWSLADPSRPALPCLHMVAVVAQDQPGTAGKFRSIMLDRDVQKVYDWAREAGGIFIVDIQVGTDDIRNILPRFDWILKNPDVHLAVDPEFYMKGGRKPGTRIGTMDAADINYITGHLAELVREHNLPPKVFVTHRFTRPMVTNYRQIELRPEVQVVMHMDGWGASWLKRDSYEAYVVKEPVHYTGFKIFYHNDTKKGDPLMMPEDVLQLRPQPMYIQYQ